MQIVQMLQHSLSSCFKNPVGVAERSLEVLVSVSYVALSEQRYPLSELLYIQVKSGLAAHLRAPRESLKIDSLKIISFRVG